MEKTGNSAGAPRRERIGEYVTIFMRGEWWYAEYSIGKKQFRTALKTRVVKRARSEAMKIEVALLQGSHAPAKKTPLLSELADEYLAYLTVEGRSSGTITRYKPQLQRIVSLASALGAIRVGDYSVKTFDAYRAARLDTTLSTPTLYQECILIKQLFNFAVRRDILDSSPLKNVRLKQPPTPDQPVFTLEQVETILVHSSAKWRAVFELLAFTGMRIGELCWLRWEDIDETRGFIYVREKEGWQPKDRESREIPINDRVRGLLNALPRGKSWVFYGKKTAEEPAGKRLISERSALARLKRVLERAGLTYGKLHTFRHFFISFCLLRGIEPTVVAKWVGHSTLKMVLKYFHLLKDQSHLQMKKLSTQNEAGAAEKVSEKKKEAGAA